MKTIVDQNGDGVEDIVAVIEGDYYYPDSLLVVLNGRTGDTLFSEHVNYTTVDEATGVNHSLLTSENIAAGSGAEVVVIDNDTVKVFTPEERRIQTDEKVSRKR
ncbi:MAG: hypothetical protein KC713_04645 [Candidatus Omnitrophica bacterium]|nr:hypothetical protein [Candidatus Omnitrophota bacterium]